MIENAQKLFFNKIDSLAADPGDSADDRLRKALLLSACFGFIPIVIPYVILYGQYGELLPAAVSLSYFVLSTLAVAIFLYTRRFQILLLTQQLLVLFSPFLFMLALGGFTNSSAVVIWAVICPFGTLVISSPEHGPRWLFAFLGLLGLAWLAQPYLPAGSSLPSRVVDLFFVLNVGAVSTMVFLLLYYFVKEKEKAYRLLNLEQEKSEKLLLNVLPKEIAPVLKNEARTIAEKFESASVLFADVVGFTPLSAELAPTEMVDLLNEIFSTFDALVEKYGLEKIRTIGDNYMVAAGVPRPRLDHCQAMANLALDMLDYIQKRPGQNGKRIEFRIGMNTGPLIGGVIGRQKFHYDVWGDTVNLASRMESQGEAGRIQITRAARELLEHDFLCTPRGKVAIKGRGEMDTWFLVGRKNGHQPVT
jgi:guanylate cyclase